jgi:hypothetical protein
MVFLSATHDNTKLYLKPFHRFGRLYSSVETFIDHPEISRMHAIVEWINDLWFVRDISKNGVWLNGDRIDPNKLYKLNIKDKVGFSDVIGIEFEVLNLDGPRDVLIPYCSNGKHANPGNEVVFLEQYHLLPSESSPEIVIFYDWSEKNWCCESVDNQAVKRIVDGDCVKFSDSMWQFFRGTEQGTIETAQSVLKPEQNLAFVFNISQDEELTELKVHHNNEVIDLKFRCHHYLTALLARYKENMKGSDLDEAFKGWVPIKKLSRDLGLCENHINIQIHRARKQLIDTCSELGLTAPLLIERKKGHARFISDNYKIFKGNKLEVGTNFAL